MTESQRSFALRAIGRQRLFYVLSGIGVGVGLLLAGFFAYQRWLDPDYALGLRCALVILVLLNARQNLRQAKYAAVLRDLIDVR